MFDIGFWELVVIAVATLLVVGPERLPGLARSAGRWYGKVNRMIAAMRSEIDRELKTDELRQTLKEQSAALNDPGGVREAFAATRTEIDRMAGDNAPAARADGKSDDDARSGADRGSA